MAKQKMVKQPARTEVKDSAGPPVGFACNGCGLVLPAPEKKCPKCGDDEAPVFQKLE
jgi:rubrerythrin